MEFQRGLEDARLNHQVGGLGAAVYARLQLLKNRGGQGRGNQLLVYQRAFHRFDPVDVPGQGPAEGRGLGTMRAHSPVGILRVPHRLGR